MLKKAKILAAVVVIGLSAPLLAGIGPAAHEWDIGPVIRGKNYSVNMPRAMRDTPAGPAFEFPHSTVAAGHVHYVTVPVRSLAGAKRMTLTYSIDAAPDVRFVAQERPEQAAALSLYFQRDRDRWNKRTPHHRWYAPFNRLSILTPGTHTVSIDFDEEWISMVGAKRSTQVRSFDAAMDEAVRVGFVFGSSSARGHGVYATGPARFTVKRFEIE